jgi:hypothetical protein
MHPLHQSPLSPTPQTNCADKEDNNTHDKPYKIHQEDIMLQISQNKCFATITVANFNIPLSKLYKSPR